MKTVTERLRTLLAKDDVTFRGLSEKINVPFTTIADWCTGRSVPPLDRAERLAKALGYKLYLERLNENRL